MTADPGFSCATCVFFSQYQPYDLDQRTTRGQCRRHAPVLHQTAEGGLKTAWPMVGERSWCGEHATISEPVIEIEPLPPIIAQVIANDKPPYDGPEWRCINCKIVEAQPTPPERCFVCRCKEFARVEA